MACTNGSAPVNSETPDSGFTFTVSQMNDDSQKEGITTVAEPVPVEKGHTNGQMSDGNLGNRHIPTGSLNNKESPISTDRERTVSSSSSDTATDAGMRKKPRKNKHKKNKADKRKDTGNRSTDDQASANASCPDCQSDLTDSDVEVCSTCFGMRKQRNNSNIMDEYCPFPFFFVKKRYAAEWMYEPEYTNWHPRVRTDSVVKENRQNQQPLDDEIHRHTDSLFSTTSNFTNYRGLLNLCLILLVLSNARLCIENLIKYGVLINPLYIAQNCFGNLNNWPNAKTLILQVIHPVFTFCLEYFFLSKGRIPESVGFMLNTINGFVQLTYPAYVVLHEHPNPVFSAFTLAITTILFLKLISYAHVNYWCRLHKQHFYRRRRQSSSACDQNDDSGSNGSSSANAPIVRYPDNLTVRDLTYFVLAPTLCYELNFPRSARIRKRFLLKRVVEMVFLIMVIIGLVQQWIVPTISNTIKPLSQLDFFKCVERLLKLSVPNLFIWLMFFYAFFHSMLNVLAELLMFGDRDFYQDWWNAETIAQFWQSWNIPVHRWAIRHIYKPMRKRGYNQLLGSTVVFLVSAFFHEYLVSVPLRMFKVWAFMGMVMQIPLAVVTGQFFEGKSGNIIVWISLILGQPIAILAYVHDYYVTTVVSVSQAANATLDTMASSSTLHAEL